MNTLEELAEYIAKKCNLDPNMKFGSVLITIMLIGIFVNIIRVIQECDKKQLYGLNQKQQIVTVESSIKNLSLKRGWYTKMRLKKILRNHMPMTEYRKYGSLICEEILNAGEKINSQQVYSLIEASNV